LRKLARNRKLQEIVDGIAASATDQAISTDRSRDKSSVTPIERAPDPGPKRQAASAKQQASSNKLTKSQASSGKRQAPSTKAQA